MRAPMVTGYSGLNPASSYQVAGAVSDWVLGGEHMTLGREFPTVGASYV